MEDPYARHVKVICPHCMSVRGTFFGHTGMELLLRHGEVIAEFRCANCGRDVSASVHMDIYSLDKEGNRVLQEE